MQVKPEGWNRWPFPRERKVVVGVVHLLPLPGAPGYEGNWSEVVARAVEDARVLAEAGVDGLIVENYGDAPFFSQRVPPETVAAMSVVAHEIKKATGKVLGINVLRNDPLAALAVAAASGAEFIRVNVLASARLTDQGIIQGQAAQVLRYRKNLQLDHIGVWADADVKHSAPLASVDLAQEVHELAWRNGADAIILTGSRTGGVVCVEKLKQVQQVAPVPLLAGSGVTPQNLAQVWPWVQGVIVGTWFHQHQDLSAPLDREAARTLVQQARKLAASHKAS